jgi:hypothetical protein
MTRPIRRNACALLAGARRALITAAAMALPAASQAAAVDLNLFYSEPGAPISIAADGSSATFSEDPNVFLVYLSNVPGLGDPQLLTPASGATFSFDYNFVEATGNEDIFHFSLLDGNTGSPLTAYELLFTNSASGSALFNLSGLVGTTLGMQFELLPDLALDLGFESQLTISNLRFEPPPPPVDVLEPGTLALMLAGFATIALRSRFRARPTR